MHSEITLLSLLCCNGHLCEAQNKRMASVDRQRAGAGKRSGNWRAELSRRANACANHSRRQASQGKHQSGAPQAFLNGTPFKFKCYGPLNDLKRFVQRMPIWPMSARRCYSCALVAAAHSHTRARARLISIARQLPERLLASALPVADALPSCWSALRRYVQCSRAVCGHGEDAANVSLLHRVDTSSGCAQPLGPQRSPPLLAHVPVCTAPPLPARADGSAAFWPASSCGHAAHARDRARLVCLLPAAAPPAPHQPCTPG